MEPTLPVLVVGPDTPSPALLEALRKGGVDPRPCAPDDVLGLLATAVAEVVVAQPVPFWRLLLSRVVTAGATAVLHVPEGPPPRALPSGVIAVQRAEDIPPCCARRARGAARSRPRRTSRPPSSSGSRRPSASRPRCRRSTSFAPPRRSPGRPSAVSAA